MSGSVGLEILARHRLKWFFSWRSIGLNSTRMRLSPAYQYSSARENLVTHGLPITKGMLDSPDCVTNEAEEPVTPISDPTIEPFLDHSETKVDEEDKSAAQYDASNCRIRGGVGIIDVRSICGRRDG
jgi:hypothetical protein